MKLTDQARRSSCDVNQAAPATELPDAGARTIEGSLVGVGA